MSHCADCGAPTDVMDRFCGRCGRALAGVAPMETGLSRFCNGCGASLEAEARFCRRCGAVAPEPKEDVFAGMPAAGNGHETVSSVSLVEELFSPRPSPATGEAPTESIPRPRPAAPRLPPPPPPEPPAPHRPGPSAAEAPTQRVERVAAPLGEVLPADPARSEGETWESSIPRAAGFPWGGAFALVGALAVIMSAILHWGGPFEGSMPRDISAAWLWEPDAAPSDPTLGLVMLLAGSLGALVSLLVMASPGWTFLRRLVGLATVTIPVGFALRTLQAVASESSIFDFPSALGVGVLVATGGAMAQVLAPRPPRR